MRIQDKLYRLGPGQVAFYFPGDSHHLEPVSKNWHVRWISMDGPLVKQIAEAFDLKRVPTHVGPCPEYLFEQLGETIVDPHPSSEIQASICAYHILAFAAGGTRLLRGRHSGKAMQIKDAIDREAMNPHFSVAVLAESCGIHRSTVSRLFSQEFGISPSEYLKRVRLNYGLTLLNESPLSVIEISRRCGFQDPVYFARLISEAWGQLPRELRGQEVEDRVRRKLNYV